MSRPLSRGEIALAWLALAVIAVLAFTPHIRHGGFYLDDWSNGAGALEPPGGHGFGNALSYFADLTIYRPVLVVYVPLTYFVFGMHMAHHLIWAAFLALFVVAMLYGILRTLGLPWIHAWPITALTLVYPWFDSTRFWATASQVSLSVGLALAGLWIALTVLSRRSWRWHTAAATLYLLSILTYEVTLPLIAAAGLLYTIRAGWKAARLRWAMDLLAVAAGGLWVGTHTARETSSFSENLTHLGEIIREGGMVLGRTLLPVGGEHTTVTLCALAAVTIAGFAALLARPDRFDGQGWGLAGWLSLVAGGLVVAGLGWFMFIPADPYYTPSVYGMTNRVNGLAGIGLVLAAYGALGIVGTLIGALRARTAVTVAAVLALGALLGAGYVDVLRRHSTIWDAAYVAERTALDRLQSDFRTLPSGTTMFIAGYPANQTLGVPILAATWDVDGMVKSEYEDGTLWAYAVLPGFHLVCHPDSIGLGGLGAPTTKGSYGTTLLVDLETQRWSKPRSRQACRKVVGSYVPGPLYLSITY
jgi:hypothetical protein